MTAVHMSRLSRLDAQEVRGSCSLFAGFLSTGTSLHLARPAYQAWGLGRHLLGAHVNVVPSDARVYCPHLQSQGPKPQ